MKHISFLIVLVWSGFLGVYADDKMGAEPAPYLQKDLRDLAAYFEGRWDNDRHVFFADTAGFETETLALRQHLRITPVDRGAGTFSFEAARSINGADPVLLRHDLSVDAEAGRIVQESRLVVTDDDGDAGSVCRIDWQRRGESFSGLARRGECDWMFGPSPDDARAAAVLTLSEQEFWVESADSQARFRRARSFSCWTAVLPGTSHGDSGAGRSDWDFQRGAELHDQGGVAKIQIPSDPERNIRLKLRDVDWPYGTNRPSLTLYVYNGESDRAVSYAWTEAGADRIGINLRWLQASCSLSED